MSIEHIFSICLAHSKVYYYLQNCICLITWTVVFISVLEIDWIRSRLYHVHNQDTN